MSRPKPIEFELHSWSIEYETQYFDSNRRGELHYMAHIKWSADVAKKESVYRAEQQIFTSFEKAKAWVDKEAHQ